VNEPLDSDLNTQELVLMRIDVVCSGDASMGQ